MTENVAAVTAEREKKRAALSSVLAAILLTAFKLIVGILTNSLGILSEAAHSGLDLVAALVTFFAVRISGRPADSEHQFGHGKVENFSALLETLLLLATSGWIIYEALTRLLSTEHEKVDASGWAFLVMGLSIVIDFSRSRVLARAARKHRSQALEADALHFSTDIWSSSVVIGGLILVRLAGLLPGAGWLVRADAVAAMVVAGIVIYISLQLGRRTVDALLDRAPPGLEERIRSAVIRVEHVQSCSRLRLRTGGSATFVEIKIHVSPDLPTWLAHRVASQVQEAVLAEYPYCDVTVQIEPEGTAKEDITGHVKALANQAGLAVHDVRVQRLENGQHLDMDVEVPPGLSLEEAHHLATQFEETLRTRLDGLAEVATHIEVAPATPGTTGEDVTARYGDLVAQVQDIVAREGEISACHNVRVRLVDGAVYISLHCICSGALSMEDAHHYSALLEDRLYTALPQVAHFLVHVEPAEAPEAAIRPE